MNLLYGFVIIGSIITVVASIMSMNRELGSSSANTATLIEQRRDHDNQLRSLNDRMTSLETRVTGIEAQLQELAAAIGKLVPK